MIKLSGLPIAAAIGPLPSLPWRQSPTNWGLVAEVVGRCELASDRCRWEELLAPGFDDLAGAREALSLGQGWTRQWTTRWKFEDGPVVCPVRDLAAMPVRGAQPVRRFSWRTS
jgi:hypothetical protein